MKKILFTLIGFMVMVFALSGVSYGWQGRMGGMGDPYGLIQDESDFLVHPAKIARGQGVRFYGDYRFTYTGSLNRDWSINRFDPGTGALAYWYYSDMSGDEYRHDALLGATFPVGPGRMGLFFEYAGKRGDYDGVEDRMGTPAVNGAVNDLEKDDNFALRLLYSLPIGGSFKLGGEAQIAYRQEEYKYYSWLDNMTSAKLNPLWSSEFEPFFGQFPHDSTYWEALFKGSMEGKIGPLDLEFTLRGGFLFGGDNTLNSVSELPVGTVYDGWDLDGGVNGWRIGGDLWLHYPLSNTLTLPFLVRADYQEKTRTADGEGYGWNAGSSRETKDEEQVLGITVGGGLEKELSKATKIAAGIYYNYLQNKNTRWITDGAGYWIDFIGPYATEHQAMVRLAGEYQLSSAVALRAGMNVFSGWLGWKFERSWHDSPNFETDSSTGDGFHWGIGASLGGTIKMKSLTLEPFVQGGYQHLAGNGDGERVRNGTVDALNESKIEQSLWFVGGGLSILFDL